MELTIDENKMKELLKDALLDMMKNNKEVFSEIIKEIIEDTAFGNAISAGRKNKFVDKKRINDVLEN